MLVMLTGTRPEGRVLLCHKSSRAMSRDLTELSLLVKTSIFRYTTNLCH